MLRPISVNLRPRSMTASFSKVAPLLFALILSLVHPATTRAAERFADIAAADDQRVAATVSGNAAVLEPLLSADLAYTHSNGKMDSRESFLGALRDGSLKYHSIQYDSREFHAASPDIVLMNGRARVEVGTPAATLVLCFLSVWRLENGQWRFLAWQSARLPPAQ
jgi:hypothetical protein